MLMQCAALKKKYRITTAGFSPVPDTDIDFIKLSGRADKAIFKFHLGLPGILRAPFSIVNKLYLLLSGSIPGFSSEDFRILKKQRYELIICHHPHSLSLAFRLKKLYASKIIFNAHEIYPLEFENDTIWMKNNFEAIDGLLKKYLAQCDYVFSVNREICDFYENRYVCKCIPIHNSKPFFDLEPAMVSNPIRIIHHGGAMPQRKLEQMADAVLACKGKYELTFMLVNTHSAYLKKLRENYEGRGVRFLPAVSYQEIIGTINKHDVGLYILPNDTINHDLALPNKMFEFLQAKLAIITSPNKALKSFVLDNGIGAVAGGFDTEDMKNLLASLTEEEIMKFKRRSKDLSWEMSSEKDEKQILKAVEMLLD